MCNRVPRWQANRFLFRWLSPIFSPNLDSCLNHLIAIKSWFDFISFKRYYLVLLLTSKLLSIVLPVAKFQSPHSWVSLELLFNHFSQTMHDFLVKHRNFLVIIISLLNTKLPRRLQKIPLSRRPLKLYQTQAEQFVAPVPLTNSWVSVSSRPSDAIRQFWQDVDPREKPFETRCPASAYRCTAGMYTCTYIRVAV